MTDAKLNLRAALIEAKADEFDSIPDIAPFRPSFTFRRKIRKLIRLHSEPLLPPVGIKLKKALVVAAIAALAVALPFASGAVRRAVAGFFTEIFENRFEIANGQGIGNIEESNKTIYALEFVPDGYEFVQTITQSARYQITEWQNGNYKIKLYQMAGNSYSKGFSSEDLFVEEIEDEGYSFIYLKGRGHSHILWSRNGYGFEIKAPEDMPKEALIRMAKSCKPTS